MADDKNNDKNNDPNDDQDRRDDSENSEPTGEPTGEPTDESTPESAATPHPAGANIIEAGIEDKMRTSYMEYSMSVIISRALPDVRDGLKPVHRRILTAMNDLNLQPGRPYRKSAKITGDTTGNYHPHGTAAVYDTMVRMAQDFSLRYPQVDGQGNFGSIDGDNAAAERYTEARLTKFATEIMRDLDKETVDFVPNYDGSRMMPSVMPVRGAQPAGQRRRRHRRGHGHQDSAAQPGRGLRRPAGADRGSRDRAGHDAGPRRPDRTSRPAASSTAGAASSTT